MASLSGRVDGPPLPPPSGLVPALSWAGEVLRAWLGITVDPFGLLAERALLDGLTRRGTISCGRATRLCAVADGVVALSLARPSDLDCVPALLERAVDSTDPWDRIGQVLPTGPGSHWVERATLLGIPCAVLGSVPAPTSGAPAVRASSVPGAPAPTASLQGLRVVDLSSLWAGPLCARLLQSAGASVVKVEGAGRPDGARSGNAEFYRRLHDGQESMVIDLSSDGERRQLASLLTDADIVIEASRPRALEQWGLGPDRFVGTGRLRAWVSITGYGRTGPHRDRVAFGDDAAVAGGLVAWEHGQPRFCSDAIADPLTGITSALAVICALMKGGSWLLDVAMARVAAACAGESC